MNIKLIFGETAFQAGVNTIKQIDASDKTFQNLVVVPDAFSMQAENLIFSVLGITATFNIEVVGISRLASKILRDNGIEFKRISSLEEIFCVFKATKSVENEFQYFKNCKMELCQKILLIIKQFKACKITPEKIVPVGDENLDKKMHDLKLVYVEYERLLTEKMDLSKLLEFFLETSENLSNLSKINLFFCNFDSFTTEINSFIVALAKNVNSVQIGVSQPLSEGNAHIFEDDIRRKTISLAKAENAVVEAVASAPNLSGERLEIVKNVFALDFSDEKKSEKFNENYEKIGEKTEKNAKNCKKNENCEFFLNVIAKNPRDEIEFVAKEIRFRLFHGARQNEFAVAVADEKYFDLVREIFPMFGILTNLDDAVSLSETILGSFLLKMLEFSKGKLGASEFEFLCLSPLCGVDENVVREIERQLIDDEDEFVEKFPKYKNYVNLTKKLKKCRKIRDFCEILLEFLKNVEENYEIFLREIENQKYYKKHSENLQAKELIEKTIEKICECGQEETLSLADFEDLLKLSFDSVKVETIPSFVDAVFVGDATDSYFEDVKNLFVVGCDSLPRAQNDMGLIDDEDIKKLKIDFALEPEIRVLNRRNRLKIFELLQHATENLVTTSPFSRDGKVSRKSDFVADLQKIFGERTIRTTSLEDFSFSSDSFDEQIQNLQYYVGCEQNLLSSFTNLLSKNKVPQEFLGTFESLISSSVAQPKRVEFVDPKFILPEKAFSATRLETWFACPFKHLIQYGFSLQEKRTIEPDARNYGSFVHELLRKFVSENSVQDLDEVAISKFLEENVKPIASMFYDSKIVESPFFVENLKNLSKIILRNVAKEQKFSHFRPKFFEKDVSLNFGKWKFIGRIDRADVCKDMFRIIDFKTGETGSIKSELFYGKKLQLFLYARAMQEQTSLTLAGVYYFNAQSRFTKNKEILRGVTRRENEVIELSDSSILDDRAGVVLGYSVKATAKNGEFAYKKGRANEDLDEMVAYSVKIAQKAISEIETGFVQDKPFDSACMFCPYLAICEHDQSRGKRRKFPNSKEENSE